PTWFASAAGRPRHRTPVRRRPVSTSQRWSSRLARSDAPWGSSLLRALVAVVAEVTIYYALPLDRGLSWWSALGLVAGLVAFVVVLAKQVAQIVDSPSPPLRATCA